MSASDSARPGGQPSITAPMAGPCDSPKLVTRKRVPRVLPDMDRDSLRGRRSLGQAAGMPEERMPFDHSIIASLTSRHRGAQSWDAHRPVYGIAVIRRGMACTERLLTP